MGSLYGANLYNPGVYSAGNLWSLAGNLTAQVSLGGTMSNPVNFAGNINIAPILASSGFVFPNYQTLAGNLNASPALAASTLGLIYTLAGNMTPVVSLAGQGSAVFGLQGNLSPIVTLGGVLGLLFTQSAGDIPVNVTLAFPEDLMTADPIWQPDADACPAFVWGADAPCSG